MSHIGNKLQGPSYLRGKVEGILTVIEARGFAVSDEQRPRILECTDLERLGLLLRSAATLADVNQLFAQR